MTDAIFGARDTYIKADSEHSLLCGVTYLGLSYIAQRKEVADSAAQREENEADEVVDYEELAIQKLEDEGCTRSDAQGIVQAEQMKAAALRQERCDAKVKEMDEEQEKRDEEIAAAQRRADAVRDEVIKYSDMEIRAQRALVNDLLSSNPKDIIGGNAFIADALRALAEMISQ